MKAGYFHCFAGAAGDMILGALLDVGLPLSELEAELHKLPLEGYRIGAERATRGTVTGTQVTVSVDATAHQARSLNEILDIIDGSALPQRVKARGKGVFRRLAAAEARAHHIPLEAVHLHEVGATDAIVDIMGAVIGFELLGLEDIYCSPLPSGGGVVTAAEGVFPVPAPATLELIAEAKAPLQVTPDSQLGELVTPTGAAILTTLARFQAPNLMLEGIGYGIGTRHIPQLPNALSLWIGQVLPQAEGELLLVETNIDDMSPELFGYVMEQLFDRGARDVWFTPIQMKKNRPAVMLSVLVPATAEAEIAETILRETPTLGLRIWPVGRHLAQREEVEFQSSLGEVKVKIKKLHNRRLSLSPEFEDCKRLAQEHGLPLPEVYRRVSAEASARLL
ncbi:MAG TPA: nickel pincer cofactor biosynthesis protein LarC [Dehalococcoidia bacterium]|nr:nickel pincer cofactor biosynthesis protein LarC [Dehalococcoidia bacterium]